MPYYIAQILAVPCLQHPLSSDADRGTDDRKRGIRHHATFAITASLLKRDFGIHDKAVEAFFDDYQAEVDDYHQSIGVGNTRSHNRQSGRDVEQLKAFVATLSLET